MYRLSETGGFGLITAAAEECGYWRMRPAAARAASPRCASGAGAGESGRRLVIRRRIFLVYVRDIFINF